MKKQYIKLHIQGFTLIELLIALTIGGILVAVAVPALNDTIKKGAVRSHQRAYSSAFNYARGEAVSRGDVVTMCASSNPNAVTPTCGKNWQDGWIIFVDNGPLGIGDQVFTPDPSPNNGTNDGDTLLKVFEYKGTNRTRVVNPDSGDALVSAITWDNSGQLFLDITTRDNARVLAQLCEKGSDVFYARALMVERSGRVLMSRNFDRSTDGVHDRAFENDSGNVTYTSLTCP